jgi:CelD/BcsL family acetyltransferase involved in cellulose biosynthesis
MKVTLLAADQLTDAHCEHWSQLQAANPDLGSPFFHPLYTREAAAALPNVEAAILEEKGEPMAYFSFQRTARNVGIPVGGSLSDFQGVVARRGFTFDAAALVRGCRLSGLRFTRLLASQQAFQPHHWLTSDSPSLDLREGFEAYCRRRREAGSTLISRIREKRRFAIRDVGPLRFEDDARRPQVLESLIAWKSRQYERIRAVNPLIKPGTLDFLRRLLALRGPEFHGVLSAIYFGERLAAVHLGLRCGNVLHYWFPTYNEELGKYSPGNICLMEQAAAAEALGIQRIDLGCGNEKFKASLRCCGTPVAEGAVGLGVLSTSLRRTWLHTKHWVQSSRFQGAARTVVRGLRGLFLYGFRHASKSRKPS